MFRVSYAQETIPISGVEGGCGSEGYTVGQLVYTNPINEFGSLQQGIRQSAA